MSSTIAKHRFVSGDGDNDLPYLLALPSGYQESAEPWPLLLFLHGAGERGEDLDLLSVHGPIRQVEDGAAPPFVVVAPQCPAYSTWTCELSSLANLVTLIAATHWIDPARIYVTGLSMGGTGTWALTARYPDRFAAAAPICGSWLPESAPRISTLPVWTFHGEDDDNIPISHTEKVVTALKQLGSPVRFTRYPGVGHNSWTTAYNDPELYEWLLAQSRK